MGCTSSRRPVLTSDPMLPVEQDPMNIPDTYHEPDEMWDRIVRHYMQRSTARAAIPLAVQNQPRAPLVAREALLRINPQSKDTMKTRAGAIIDTCDRLMLDIQSRAADTGVTCVAYTLSRPSDETALARFVSVPPSYGTASSTVIQAGEQDLKLLKKLLRYHGFSVKFSGDRMVISWDHT